MQRLANGTQVATLPAPAALVGTPGFGTNGDPAIGPQASVFDADQYNRLQEEICSVIAAAGIALNVGDNSQLLEAIRALFEPILGYAPVQQGTGLYQSGNSVKVGYSNGTHYPSGKTLLSVDATDFGPLALESWVTAQGYALASGMKSGIASAAQSNATVQEVLITFPTPFPTACTFAVAFPTGEANFYGSGSGGFGYWPTSSAGQALTRNGFSSYFDTLTGVGSGEAVNFDHTFYCSWIAWGY